MLYLLTFLEGILTFISPCILPMIPIYLAYFGGMEDQDGKRTIRSAAGFILGFTVIFVSLGALSGIVGKWLVKYALWFNLVCGIVLILFGISQLGIFQMTFFKGKALEKVKIRPGFFPSMLFGAVFSISWTPCVSTFLGTALIMASQRGSVVHGMVLLLVYSLGLGIPFLLSAVLLNSLKQAFDWIKRHYVILQRICGILLILLGILMATGLFGKWAALVS